jgi:TATA-box binding protein (TBP) (component of TFIID and TFIIIB)
MANPLYQQLAPKANNNMLQQIMQFKKMINGDPQQIVQNMISSGRISQEQVNQYAQQANEIYKQFKDLM